MKKLLLASLALTLLGGMSYAVDYAEQKEEGFKKFEVKNLVFKSRGSGDGAVPMGSFKGGGKPVHYTGESNLGPKSLKGDVPSLSEDGAGKRKPSLGDKVKGFAAGMRDNWNKLPPSGKLAVGGTGVMVGGVFVLAAGIVTGSAAATLIGLTMAGVGEGASLTGGVAWLGH